MKIGIFALLQNLDPAYSVATVVRSHIRMFQKHGHEVVLLTSTDSSIKSEDVNGAEVRAVIPVWQFRDYTPEQELTPEDHSHLIETFRTIEPHITEMDFVVEHDCILQGWFRVHGETLNKFPNIHHVIHSIPKNPPVQKLGFGHKLLVLNPNQVENAKQQYKTEDVTAITNPLDIREFLGFSDITRRFIKDWDLLSYDHIFVYPLSATRWDAKGVPFLAEFTKYMENQGIRIALVLLLAHSETLKELRFDTCHFSNAMYPEHKSGVPREVVRDFMLLADGFFLPSSSELSPLVHMEAALAKNPVFLNRILKVESDAETANLSDRLNSNFELLLNRYKEASKHLTEFRRVRKEMNEDAIGKKLNAWLCG